MLAVVARPDRAQACSARADGPACMAFAPRPLVDVHVVRQHRKKVRLRFTTGSLYERTVARRALWRQGCRAGRTGAHGIVVLDFGRQAYNGHTYGTILFSGRFASNRSISYATRAYARGYARCTPRASHARITLARGTSNYGLYVPSPFRAGRRWARETMRFALYLRRHGLDGRVRAAAADDVEPAWDRGFHRTHAFFRGFHSARTGYLLYNYGSLDGGVGHIWTLRQAFYVSGGMRYARALPEIYYPWMARQWAELSRLAVRRYGRPVSFAGLMTQHWRGCRRCGFRPHEARRALVRELSRHPRTRLRSFGPLTNIGTA